MSTSLAVPISSDDLAFLGRAAEYLENPSFLLKVANLLGKPLETLAGVLPQGVRDAARDLTDRALRHGLEAALLTLPRGDRARVIDEPGDAGGWDRIKHNLAAGVTGAVAGGFGLAALAVELPITTTIVLRDIATVARSLGEDLDDREVKLQCLAVFSMGGGAKEGELKAMESSYYATRLGLSGTIREAAQYAARVTAEQLARDLAAGASPALVRLVAAIAGRFNVVVSQKLVAQAVPAIGAVGGALVNVAFAAHFDRVARCHFGIRALERTYGREVVQAAYRAALHEVKLTSVKPANGQIGERNAEQGA